MSEVSHETSKAEDLVISVGLGALALHEAGMGIYEFAHNHPAWGTLALAGSAGAVWLKGIVRPTPATETVAEYLLDGSELDFIEAEPSIAS